LRSVQDANDVDDQARGAIWRMAEQEVGDAFQIARRSLRPP
jgi:hypothetical protein